MGLRRPPRNLPALAHLACLSDLDANYQSLQLFMPCQLSGCLPGCPACVQSGLFQHTLALHDATFLCARGWHFESLPAADLPALHLLEYPPSCRALSLQAVVTCLCAAPSASPCFCLQTSFEQPTNMACGVLLVSLAVLPPIGFMLMPPGVGPRTLRPASQLRPDALPGGPTRAHGMQPACTEPSTCSRSSTS